MSSKPLFRLLPLLLWLLCGAATADDEALDLLRTSERLMRDGGTEGVYRVRIIRPEWQRELRLKSIDDAVNERFRLELLKPRKVRGTVFLKKGDRLTMYLPKLRREISISPAMMHDPWMGSDFNNQDLLESAALIDRYDHRITGREGEGAKAVVTIESTPKPDAAVSWHKLVQRIRADGLPLEIEYHCLKPERERVLRFEAPRDMDGRLVPGRWVMQPQATPDQRTEIEVEELHFGGPFDDALFGVSEPKKQAQ